MVRFQQLYLNTSTSSLAASSAAASSTSLPSASPLHSRTVSSGVTLLTAVTSDKHASGEEMGRGNHTYFRRHKSMETIRSVSHNTHASDHAAVCLSGHLSLMLLCVSLSAVCVPATCTSAALD
jgi:hypothetical protein